MREHHEERRGLRRGDPQAAQEGHRQDSQEGTFPSPTTHAPNAPNDTISRTPRLITIVVHPSRDETHHPSPYLSIPDTDPKHVPEGLL